MHNTLVHFCLCRCTPLCMHVCMLPQMHKAICLWIPNCADHPGQCAYPCTIPVSEHDQFCVCAMCEVVQCRLSGSYQSVFLLGSSAFLTTTPYRCCQSQLSSATQAAGEGIECLLHSPPLLPTINSPPPLRTDRRCVCVCVCVLCMYMCVMWYVCVRAGVCVCVWQCRV